MSNAAEAASVEAEDIETYEMPRRYEQELAHEAIAWRAAKINDFNAKMEKRQMPGRVEFTYDLDNPIRCTEWTEFGPREFFRYPTTTEMVGDYHVGDWRLVGMYDWMEDSDEAFRCRFPEDFDHDARPIDRRVCDHCGVRARRRRVFVIDSEADGIRHVGGSCIKDYTGHSPYSVLRFWDSFKELMDDPEWGSAGRTSWLTREFVEQAAAVIRTYGFESARSYGTPTISRVYDSLNRKVVRNHYGGIEYDGRVPITDEDRNLAAATLSHFANIEPKTDFDRNARVVAQLDLIHDRTDGLATFLPEGYLRHLGKEAERKAKAEAAAKAIPTPTDDGPHVIEGTVVKRAYQEPYTYHGLGTWKITVRDDRGFTVWGSEPGALETNRGDRVRFVCSEIIRSDRDEAFGFFKRPRRFEVTEPALEIEVAEPPDAAHGRATTEAGYQPFQTDALRSDVLARAISRPCGHLTATGPCRNTVKGDGPCAAGHDSPRHQSH